MRRFFRWLVIFLVKPCLTLWIIVNGIPPSIRAIGSVVREIGKLFK